MVDRGPSESFGSELRAFRERAGLSQSAVARRAGLDPSFINRLESGQRGADRTVAEALIQGLGLDEADADRLLAAGGHLPGLFARLGLQDATLQQVARILADDRVGADDRIAFRQVIELIVRLGLQDPTLRQVVQILADDRLSLDDRAEFRQVVELIARRWQPRRDRS